MNENGKIILKTAQQMMTVFKDISNLLLTVDDLMKKKGWTNNGSTVWADGSQSISSPEQWMPNELFRFYIIDKYPHYLVFVSVLLNDHVDGKYAIEEPLITAGFFDYGEENIKEIATPSNCDYRWDYWYAKCHGFIKNRKDDGTIHTIEEKEWEKRWGKSYQCHFKYAKCFGLPLTSITNSSDVQSKIVVPLIKLFTS